MKTAPSLLLIGFASLLAPELGASAAELQARLSCAAAEGPGRILCELTTSATSGDLVWSDALIVRAPAFARPLRSRLVAQFGTAAGPGKAWAKLALVAAEPGQGKLELLARGVVCREGPAGERCTAQRVLVTADVLVGPASPPAQP